MEMLVFAPASDAVAITAVSAIAGIHQVPGLRP